jgi:hypothetical protein
MLFGGPARSCKQAQAQLMIIMTRGAFGRPSSLSPAFSISEVLQRSLTNATMLIDTHEQPARPMIPPLLVLPLALSASSASWAMIADVFAASDSRITLYRTTRGSQRVCPLDRKARERVSLFDFEGGGLAFIIQLVLKRAS